jgi:acyl dehydratase
VHSLDSLYEGLEERFVFKATDEMMQSFVEISGDVNPVHTDSNYAASRGFDGMVVYGGILVAQISRMVGMHLPGRDALWNSLNIQFAHPLLVGQTAELEARVDHISEATSSIELKFKITSQGKTLARGSAGVQILKPDGQ